jgi:hypothetical protein
VNYSIEIESGALMYMPSFIKIGTGLQAILRFSLRNLRGCNVGVTLPIFIKLGMYIEAADPISAE